MLDPFVGVGGTLLACSMTDRHGVGIDLSQDYLDLYQEVSDDLGLEPQTVCQGNALQLEEILTDKEYLFDLVLTDPPYVETCCQKNGLVNARRKQAMTPRPLLQTIMKTSEICSPNSSTML